MVDIATPAAYCPNCGAEYRTGFETCLDCGTELLRGPLPDDWAPADPIPKEPESKSHPEPVTLCTLPWDEAWLLAGKLNDEGIEARVDPDTLAPYTGLGIPPMGRNGYDVVVPKGRIEEAREIARGVATR
jgi:hypothetical protein